MGRKRTQTADRSVVVAYLRVSTAAQAESGIGLEAQRRAIEEAAQAQGLAIAGWYEDAGRSGARMANRPGLQAAISEVEAGRASGLVVAKIDRLGRSSGDVLGLVERATRDGWRIIALDVGLDSGTPAGEMVVAALSMAARFEWRRISERQNEKFAELRRQGRPRGRAAVSREVAARIAGLRDSGLSFARIAEHLNDQKIPTARGGSRWYAASVRSALVTRERELEAQAA